VPGYLPDAGNIVPGAILPENYPAPAAGTAIALATYVDPLVPLLLGSSMTIELLVNGAPSGLLTTYSGAGPASGLLQAAGAVAIAAGDLLDLRVTPAGIFQTPSRLSAMVQVV